MPRFDRRTGLCLLLLTAVLAAYAPALLHGGFPWDDYKFVEANPRLVGLDGLLAIWLHPGTLSSRGSAVPEVEVHWFPVLYTSFWIERWFWGSFRAPGFHGTNLAIHFCNALLVWRLLARFRVPGPFLVALIWAVHPGAMEAVGFVMGRKDLLPAFFILLGTWLWFRRFPPPLSPSSPARYEGEPPVAPHAAGSRPFRGPGRPGSEWHGPASWSAHGPAWSAYGPAWSAVAGTILLGLAGVLCKTTTVVFPVLLLLLHLWRGDPPSRRLAVRLAVLQGVLLGMALFQWFVFARLSDPAVHDFSFLERILLSARAAWTHLFLTLVPGTSPLRFYSWTVSPTDPAGWTALLAGGVVLLIAFRLRPRGRPATAPPPFPHAGAVRAVPRFPQAGAGLALLWFLACLSPTLGLVDHESLHLSFASSRYRYLASLGPWALAVGAGLAALRRVSRWPHTLPRTIGRGALRGLGLAVLLTAGLTTARFSILFSNDATWFQHLARHAPASDWLASHFVHALIRAGHTGRALRAAEVRFLSDPSRVRYRRDRAVARMAAGRRTQAEADFRVLVSLLDRDPGLIPQPPCVSPRTVSGPWPLERNDLRLIYFNYGILLAGLGRPLEARDMFFRAQQVRPAPGDVWIFRAGPADPPVVATGPPPGPGGRRCGRRPARGRRERRRSSNPRALARPAVNGPDP